MLTLEPLPFGSCLHTFKNRVEKSPLFKLSLTMEVPPWKSFNP